MATDWKATDDPLYQAFTQAWGVSSQFCEPYFEAMWRAYKLWRGYRPSVLNNTWSKIVLNDGHAMVQDRIPTLLDNWLGGARPCSVRAKVPRDHLDVQAVESWLHWKLFDESEVNLRFSGIHTLTQAVMLGTSYRMPFYVPESDGAEARIGTKPVNPFSIVPAPDGGLLNVQEWEAADACSYFFHLDYWSNEHIERWVERDGGRPEVWRHAKDKPHDWDAAHDSIAEYSERFRTEGKVDSGLGMTNGREAVADIFHEGLDRKDGQSGDSQHPYAKRRVYLWHDRRHFRVIVQGMYCVYDGPPLLGDGILPLVKYTPVPDMLEWFGISGTEMIHDLLVAQMMNLNYRFDWMANTLNPALWIRDDLLRGKSPATFRNRPGAIHPFGTNISDINQALFWNRAPEINQQHFVEEQSLRSFIEKISGMPSVARGVSDGQESATMGMALVRKAVGRLGVESIMVECSAVEESRLLLRLAGKYVLDPQTIRDDENESGFPFRSVQPGLLEDRYTIVWNGTRQRALHDAAFQRLIAMYPLWSANPLINPEWLTRLSVQMADVSPDTDGAILTPQANPAEVLQAGGNPTEPALGGAASAQDMGQRQQAVDGQRAQQPGGTNPRPALEVARQ